MKTTRDGAQETRSAPPGDAPPREIREQLRKILSDDSFRRSERLCRFLRFVVDTALDGRSDEIKEYTIAVNVYDKDDSFDPRTDPIVRVEASRLRRKLAEYYTSNQDDAILIRLRKRGYRPVIRRIRSRYRAANTVEAKAARPGPPLGRADLTHPFSIVVLPFKDLSADQSQEFFCEAITERLTSLLARLRGIRTVAHTTALQFSDRSEDVRRIGSELEVDCLLEGSVQRSGRRIRVTAGLSRTEDGLNIWNETYDRQLKDVLALQDDLAESVAASLQNTIVRSSASPEDAATRWHQIGLCRLVRSRESSLDLTIDAFRRSVRADPGFAEAGARLVECLVLKMLHVDAPLDAVVREARQIALRAAQSNPDSATVQASLGAVESHWDRSWKSAEKRFLRALNLEPDRALPHDWYAVFYLLPMRRFDDALSELQIALRLDPTSVWTHVDLALAHYMHGNHESAAEQSRLVLGFEPRSRTAQWTLARSQLGLGRFDAARGTLEWAVDISKDPFRMGILGRANALAGRTAEARRLLEKLDERSHMAPYAKAEICLGLGEADQALDWLERAAGRGVRFLNWAGADPLFDEVRTLPRFQGLLRDLDLPVEDSESKRAASFARGSNR